MPLLDVILGYDCNLACDYCTITPAMRTRAMDTRAVVRELRRGRGDGFDAVSFTGGEPTIRADLLPLVREARSLGYGSIKVQSNGLAYAHAPNVARLVAAGATKLHVSIHTHRPELYDALVRRDDSYSAMESGLRNAVATGVHVVADVIMKSDTYRDLAGAIDFVADRGVREAHLWLVSLTDGNRDHVASLPRMTDAVAQMRTAFARGRERGVTVRSLHVPRCLLGDDVAAALDPGADGVRVVTPDAVFDLRDSKLGGQMKVAACTGCEYDAVCPGIRPDYLEVYGDQEIAAARGQSSSVMPTRRLPLAV